jgi:hypothetical protein
MAEMKNIYASLTSFTQDFIAGRPHPATFVDFDNHAEEVTLPDGDLIGLRGLSVDTSGTTMTIMVMFCVSTVDDTNLFRHRDIVDALFTKLLPTKSLSFLDADNGVALGYLKVADGTQVLPIAKATTRSIQQIAVSLLADRKPAL